MKKTVRNQRSNFEEFVESMSRVLGISRKTLNKFMSVQLTPPRHRRQSAPRRKATRSGILAR